MHQELELWKAEQAKKKVKQNIPVLIQKQIDKYQESRMITFEKFHNTK